MQLFAARPEPLRVSAQGLVRAVFIGARGAVAILRYGARADDEARVFVPAGEAEKLVGRQIIVEGNLDARLRDAGEPNRAPQASLVITPTWLGIVPDLTKDRGFARQGPAELPAHLGVGTRRVSRVPAEEADHVLAPFAIKAVARGTYQCRSGEGQNGPWTIHTIVQGNGREVRLVVSNPETMKAYLPGDVLRVWGRPRAEAPKTGQTARLVLFVSWVDFA